MKWLIFLSSAIALINLTIAFQSNQNCLKDDELFNEVLGVQRDESLQGSLANFENLLNETKGEERSELREAIELIKLVESMQIPQVDIVRKKRQAGPINCTALNLEFATIANQILIIQQNITNTTATLVTINQRVVLYTNKVSTSSGTPLVLNTNLLKAYTSLATSASTTLKNLEIQLATLQDRKAQIESILATNCNLTMSTFPTTISTTTTLSTTTPPTTTLSTTALPTTLPPTTLSTTREELTTVSSTTPLMTTVPPTIPLTSTSLPISTLPSTTAELTTLPTTTSTSTQSTSKIPITPSLTTTPDPCARKFTSTLACGSPEFYEYLEAWKLGIFKLKTFFETSQPSATIPNTCATVPDLNMSMPACGTPEFNDYLTTIKSALIRDFQLFSIVPIEFPVVPITTSTPEKTTTTIAATTTSTPLTATTTNAALTTPALVYDSTCGTFAKYDTYNNVQEPETKGFAAGFYKDGSVAYVGYGNNVNAVCNQNPCPGRVTTNPTKPGIFMPCGAIDQYDRNQTYYLLNSPNLQWQMTDVVDMGNQAGRIQVPKPSATPFLIGRIKIGNYTQLGKVRNWPDYAFNFMQDGKENTFYSGFEVLTCQPPPCGSFVKYDPVNKINDPETKGFSAGPYKDGTPAYVGHGKGNQNNCNQNPVPGRITTTPIKPGIIVPCNGASFDNTEVYYLLNHDDLRWVRTDIYAMQNLTNALKVTSYTGFPYFYGRIKIGDHYQVGKVHNGNGYITGQFIDDSNTEQGMLYGFDVLVCDSSLPKTTTPTVTPVLPTPLVKCGDVAKYDVVNNRTDPEIYGFLGGLYKDASKAYVGYGNNGPCTSNIMPGRITTDVTKPGIYTPCGADIFDNTKVFYMLNHPNLRWQAGINSPHKGLAESLRLFDAAGHSYYYSRLTIGTYTQLGKVFNTYDVNDCWYTQDNKEYKITAGYEILMCDPPTCGSFAKFDAKVNFTEPNTKGFIGGKFKDGRISYVGYGNNWSQNCQYFPSPGRISTDPTLKGTYLSCNNDVLDSDYAYYLLNHDDLRWVDTDVYAMRTLQGAVTITSNNGFPFLFGRIKVGSRYIAGKVHSGNGAFKFYFIQDDGNEVGISFGFEVLVCNSAIPKPAA